jgi:hypothetical protein
MLRGLRAFETEGLGYVLIRATAKGLRGLVRPPKTGTEGLPVQKFRSVEPMDGAPLLVALGDGFDRFLRHCARFWAIAPRVYPRGVFKFRSIEEAQAARQRVADEGARVR